MSPPLFTHPERDLATRFGLPLEKIRGVRAAGCVRGTDWQREANEIRYSEVGLAKLTAALGLATGSAAATDPEPDAGPAALCQVLTARAVAINAAAMAQKNSAPNATECALTAGAEHELVVVRTYALNRRIVLAKLKLGNQPARVRVRDSGKLTPGMIMRCVFVELDLWNLNQRLPRHRGRW